MLLFSLHSKEGNENMTKSANLKVVATVLALAVAMALIAVLTTKSAHATSRFKVVTRTFSNPNSILIPGTGTSGTAAPYPSRIKVSDLRQGTIKDVNVKIRGYIHTFPDDVDVLLISPTGRDAIIMSDAGGSNAVNGVNLTIDDEAPIFFPDSGQIVSTSYMPSNYDTILDPFPTQTPSGNRPLSHFDGTNPNGRWRLFVVDDTSGDSGQFAGGWALQIKARVLR